MRLLMQRASSIRIFNPVPHARLLIQLIDIRSHIVIALRTQEKAVLRPPYPSGNPQVFMKA